MDFNKDRIKSNARAAAEASLYRSAKKVADESQTIVPRQTGKLASSQYVKVDASSNPSATVGYKADYAKTVHESDSDGAKFLKKPFDRLKNECLNTMRVSIEEAIR